MSQKFREWLRDKLQKVPEWAKLSTIFVVGLIASPAVQNLVDEFYSMNNAIFTGNVTLIAEYLEVSGGKLLYNLVLAAILIGLFIYLVRVWSKKEGTMKDDIGMIKEGVNELLDKKRGSNK